MNKLQIIFGDCRIVGLAGSRNTGKTNNLVSLLKDFREENKDTHIFYYGMNDFVSNWIKSNIINSFEISSIEQLNSKQDSLIVIDEFQRLKLNDRRYRDLLNSFCDFVYHSNNRVILCSPSLREFNSVIGSKIERWLFKSLNINELINGSQIKNAALMYNGRRKVMNSIIFEDNEILIFNNDVDSIITLEYIQEADSKFNNKDILSKMSEKLSEVELSRKSQRNCQEIVSENVGEIVRENVKEVSLYFNGLKGGNIKKNEEIKESS